MEGHMMLVGINHQVNCEKADYAKEMFGWAV
jgi:hypothetical protein